MRSCVAAFYVCRERGRIILAVLFRDEKPSQMCGNAVASRER